MEHKFLDRLQQLVSLSQRECQLIASLGQERTVPEGSTLGRWEFGSSESAAAFQPSLRLIVTPPTEFELP